MKVILNVDNNYELLELTEDQLRFFEWLQDNYDLREIGEISIQRVGKAEFEKI